MNIGIVGATGQVGTVMREILAQRNFPIESIRFFASPRSAGKEIEFQGQSILVEDAASAKWGDLDAIALTPSLWNSG